MAGIRVAMDDLLSYLETLTLLDGSSMENSRRKAFILGFKTAASSFIGLGRYLFDKYDDVKYLRAFQIGQDHIETLFQRSELRVVLTTTLT